MSKKLKIYLAGPDVFEVKALKKGEQLKELCNRFGYKGLFPLDNTLQLNNTPHQNARRIRQANIELIQKADIIMANLNPFRGLEPDSGTVFEVGYAMALGKIVVGYAQDRRSMLKKVQKAQHLPKHATLCNDGKIIEDFDLSHNLMFADILVAKSPKKCLKWLNEHVSLED
ncbi:MAG TPA: nucleoside 2-deoxyribosyltransferase [Helicobacteraceae bacterium]|nr:nucleoside 2-deoxyribosyltransferase [Helicobacteraceae bacterium]